MQYVELFVDILSYIALAGMVIFAMYSFFEKESRMPDNNIKPPKPPYLGPDIFDEKDVVPADPTVHPSETLVYRLEERARIRRQIPGRKSVQEGKPDRIADLLEEAAAEIKLLRELKGVNDVKR